MLSAEENHHREKRRRSQPSLMWSIIHELSFRRLFRNTTMIVWCCYMSISYSSFLVINIFCFSCFTLMDLGMVSSGVWHLSTTCICKVTKKKWKGKEKRKEFQMWGGNLSHNSYCKRVCRIIYIILAPPTYVQWS